MQRYDTYHHIHSRQESRSAHAERRESPRQDSHVPRQQSRHRRPQNENKKCRIRTPETRHRTASTSSSTKHWIRQMNTLHVQVTSADLDGRSPNSCPRRKAVIRYAKHKKQPKDGRVCDGRTHTITYKAVKTAVQLTPNAVRQEPRKPSRRPSTTERKQKCHIRTPDQHSAPSTSSGTKYGTDVAIHGIRVHTVV
jgi:hypothetical protein